MVAIQVRDVPEEIRDALAAQAEAEGLSLQRYLLRLMAEQARHSRNVAWMHRFEGRDDGSRSGPDLTVAELADERDRDA